MGRPIELTMSDYSTSDSEEELTIADDYVVTKYKMAGQMNDKVLKTLIPMCSAGANVRDICKFGDEQITKEAERVFKREKEMLKGIAFPTCISVNNCVCHYSPLDSEKDVIELADGDVVKIDLGTHIDGFIAAAAHTFVVGASKDNPVTGKKADAIKAAHNMSEAAIRLVKPGNKTAPVTEAWNKIAKDFNCTPVVGMLSHQLKQNSIKTTRKTNSKCMRCTRWTTSPAQETVTRGKPAPERPFSKETRILSTSLK